MSELSRERRLENARKKLENFKNFHLRNLNQVSLASSETIIELEPSNVATDRPQFSNSNPKWAPSTESPVAQQIDQQEGYNNYPVLSTEIFNSDPHFVSLPIVEADLNIYGPSSAFDIYAQYQPPNDVSVGPETTSHTLLQSQNHGEWQPAPQIYSGMTTAATETAYQIAQQMKRIINPPALPPAPSASHFVLPVESNSPHSFRESSPVPQSVGVKDGPNLCSSLQSLPTVLNQASRDCTVSRHSSVSGLGPLCGNYLGYSGSTSASAILVRELQQRNVELASMLDQRNDKHDRAVAQVAALREQLQREKLSADEKRANLETATQRELVKARDQVRAHAQTVGALVAEKTELQTKLSHMERLTEQRSKELDDAHLKLTEARQKIRSLEDTTRLAQIASDRANSVQQESDRQLERARSDLQKEREFRIELATQLQETEARLSARELDVSRLNFVVEDLKRQLEVTMIFSGSKAESGALRSSPASTVDCVRCSALKDRIHELESSGIHLDSEKSRLESQYKACVSELERQVDDLKLNALAASDLKADFQSAIEDMRRQMTVKESQLTDLVSEIECLRAKNTQLQLDGEVELAASSEDSVKRPTEVDDEMIVVSEMYQKLKSVSEVLQLQVVELNAKLLASEAKLAESEMLLRDHNQVLATATSERAALSRAVDQNRKVKDHLTALQNALEHVSTERDDAVKELEDLRKRSAEALQTKETLLEAAHGNCKQLNNEFLVLNQLTAAVTQSSATVALTPTVRKVSFGVQVIDEIHANTFAAMQTDCSITKMEADITRLSSELSSAQDNYCQLEKRFLEISERFCRVDEEKGRLEAAVAQLEMESSSIGEYITLFAHRRAVAQKRARLRESLLARLVRDRQVLRVRLAALIHSASVNGADGNRDFQKNTENLPPSESLVTFKIDLAKFMEDLDASQVDDICTGPAEVDDELTVDRNGFGISSIAENGAHQMKGASSILSPLVEGSSRQTTFNLDEQLRLLAVHDCPHCECCSGSLLVV